MKKKLLLAFSMGVITLGLRAQVPAIQWQKCYGGTGSDVATCIKQTKDGGYIVVGTSASTSGDVTNNHGGSDIWVVKTDASGTLQWQKTIGGTAEDDGYDVGEAKNGAYYIAGYTLSSNGDLATAGNHGGGDALVAKLDVSGNVKWVKCFGGSGREQGFAIVPTHDGGCVVAGGSSSSSSGQATGHHGSSGVDDMWMAKVDSMGTFLWNKCFGGAGDDGLDTPGSIIETADRGFLVTGNSVSTDGDMAGAGGHGASDWLVVKTDSLGAKQWAKAFGGSDDEDPPTSLVQNRDGGYTIIGNSASTDGQVTGHHGTAGGSNDVWVIRITSAGALSWQKSLGGSAEDNAEPGSITKSADGYLISSTSSSNDGDVTGNHGSSDYWLVQIDSLGTIKWQKSLGGTGADAAGTSLQTSDYGFIVCGGGASSSGDITGNKGSDDFWVAKLSGLTAVANAEIVNNEVVVYPNPSQGLVTLRSAAKMWKLEVVNAMGEKIYSAEVNSNEARVDMSHQAKGVYFYTLTNSQGVIGRGHLILK
jgi:Secretion system C-terminal sorting domain